MKSEKEYLSEARKFIEDQGFYLMKEKDIPLFTECAAKSYGSVSYPLNDYFVGHSCTEKELEAMWVFNLKYFIRHAVIYSDGPQCNAWLLWIPPGCKGVNALNFLLYGGLKMTRALGLDSLKRIMHYEDYSKEVRLAATGGKEWYWYNLVVRPEAQGQHLVTRLLPPMLEFCKATGHPVYLETHLEKNTCIYRHFGFEIVSDGILPGTDLRHWGMVQSCL